MFKLASIFSNTPQINQPPEPISALQQACESEDLNALREAASTAGKDDLNAALCRTCRDGKVAVIEILLDTPNTDPDVIHLLLDRGADPAVHSTIDTHPRSREPRGLTPLHAISRPSRRIPHNKPIHLDNSKRCVTLLLEAGCDINASDSQGNTLLHQILHREIPLGEFLVNRGADPNATNEKGETPMHKFVDVANQPGTLRVFMEHGARLDIRNTTNGRTPLHEFAASKNLGDLSLFRPYVSDWSVTDSGGNTLLHTIAKHYHIGDSTFAELIKAGLSPTQRNNDGCADIEAKDHNGRTPLIRIMDPQKMSIHGYAESIKVLLSKGANLNAQDYQGNNILHYTINDHRLEVDQMNVLLSLGVDPALPNYNGNTFLHSLAAHIAPYQDDKGVLAVRALLQNGMSPTIKNHKGQTPLHLLCTQVSQHYFAPTAVLRIAAIDVLLDAGLVESLNTPDYDVVLPIHLATTISELLVGKLISRGADTTRSTKDGRNLLHIASAARQSNIVGLLLEKYASIDRMDLVNAQCNNGRTPLHEACRSGRIETVALLLDAGADVHAAKIRDLDGKGHRPLDACLEFGEEKGLWESSEDEMNMFHQFVAGGVLGSDATRPRPPNTRRKVHKKRATTTEIRSENDTVSIAPIIRLLVSRGAKFESGRRWSDSIVEDARRAGLEEAVVELYRLVDQKATALRSHRNFKLDYMKLRSQYLPTLLDWQFQQFFSHYDVMHLILHRHFDELVQALERRVDASGIDAEGGVNRALSQTLVACARYGYHDLFARIGSLIHENGWINRAEGSLKEKLIPYLLAATQRSLPNLEVIKVIVEKFHADVKLIFAEGMTFVPDVPFCSQVDAARKYKPGDTVLHYLAQGGHWWHKEAIKYLVEHGADVNARNKQGKTPLCYALASDHLGGYGQREITKILLDGGADSNIPAYCGWTPLGIGAHDNELVKLLLQHGAQPSNKHPMELFNALVPNQPEYILHPLHYISMSCFNEAHARDHAIAMIKHLLSCGADPYLLADGQRSILHKIFGEDGIIQPYLDIQDLDLERRDALGRTLLLAAACSSCGTNSYNFDVSLLPSMDQHFRPAFYIEGDQTRALALYERGADITAVDNGGNNVLHWLVQHECPGKRFSLETNHQVNAHQRTIELFLKKVPELATQINNKGSTPLEIAQQMQHQWAIDALTSTDVPAEEPQR
ncbi:hypothetical protein BDV06DRAFT_231461 [Aspergillus oleicola]